MKLKIEYTYADGKKLTAGYRDVEALTVNLQSRLLRQVVSMRIMPREEVENELPSCKEALTNPSRIQEKADREAKARALLEMAKIEEPESLFGKPEKKPSIMDITRSMC